MNNLSWLCKINDRWWRTEGEYASWVIRRTCYGHYLGKLTTVNILGLLRLVCSWSPLLLFTRSRNGIKLALPTQSCAHSRLTSFQSTASLLYDSPASIITAKILHNLTATININHLHTFSPYLHFCYSVSSIFTALTTTITELSLVTIHVVTRTIQRYSWSLPLATLLRPSSFTPPLPLHKTTCQGQKLLSSKLFHSSLIFHNS